MRLLYLDIFKDILKDEERIYSKRNYVFTGLTKDRVEMTKRFMQNSNNWKRDILELSISFDDTDITNLKSVLGSTITFPSDKHKNITTIVWKNYLLGLIVEKLRLSSSNFLSHELNFHFNVESLSDLRKVNDFKEYRERLMRIKNATNMDQTLYRIVQQTERDYTVMLHFFLDDIKVDPQLQAEINSYFDRNIKPFISRIYSQNPLLHYDSSSGNRLDPGVDFNLYTGIYEDNPKLLEKKE